MSSNTVSMSSCEGEVILTLGRDTQFSLTYRLAPQVVQHPAGLLDPQSLHTHIPNSHIRLSSCNTTLAVIWGLFVIFSGALSGRRSDISVSAQKPSSGVTHN